MSDGPDETTWSRTVGQAEKVREAFDALPMMAVALEGPSLRYTATNAAFRASVGRSQVIGLPLREAFPETAEQQVMDLSEQVYTTGQPAAYREYRVQLRTDDGELIEIFVDFVFAPMRAPDGTVTGVIGTGTDVTAAVYARRAVEQQSGEAQRRFAEARDVISTLQSELLPKGVPVLPGVRIAASYLLADTDAVDTGDTTGTHAAGADTVGTAAGGDWFDAVALPGGLVALIVGDVVGHGVAASATMGQLRIVLRERLAATGDLSSAIGALDRMAGEIRGARAATVCVVLLDPGSGDLSYCTAGHPPPLVLPVTGQPWYLPPSGAGPLGVGGQLVTANGHIHSGELLLLYTDGILERPGRDLSSSTVELAQVAADIAADRVFRGDSPWPVDRLATQTLELLTRVTGHSDDITLLAAQRTDPPAGFSIQVAAETVALGEIRVALGGWMDTLGVCAHDVSAVQHAVTELVTNAAEHAYPGSTSSGSTSSGSGNPGSGHASPVSQHPVTIAAALTPAGRLKVEVRDRGRWCPPNPSLERGLGLAMASKLVDAVHLHHDDTGTTATVEHELSRPARLLTAGEVVSGVRLGATVPAEPFLLLNLPSTPTPRIRVDGPVDASTALQLDVAMNTAGAGGTRELIVDLAGVTHLASAGVATLHKLVALGHANGGQLRLYAPLGSTADMIMTLVDLDHEVADPPAIAG